MSAPAEPVSPYDTPQSASARFLIEIVAWVTGPWAAAEILGSWLVAVPVAAVLLVLPAMLSTPGDKRKIVVATPGRLRVGIELLLVAVAVAASAVVLPTWSWYAVLALALAVVITNIPRLKWLWEGAPPV